MQQISYIKIHFKADTIQKSFRVSAFSGVSAGLVVNDAAIIYLS